MSGGPMTDEQQAEVFRRAGVVAGHPALTRTGASPKWVSRHFLHIQHRNRIIWSRRNSTSLIRARPVHLAYRMHVSD
jgi:hypothetical protein